MAEALMKLQLAGQAEIAYDTLSEQDRRLIDERFERLRHWRDDDYVRSHSILLEADEGVYALRPGTDYIVVFKVADDQVTVLSIFTEEALRRFHGVPEGSTT